MGKETATARVGGRAGGGVFGWEPGGGPRGVDALEEGRRGARERCGSSENVGEGAQRDSGRYRRKVGRGRRRERGGGLG